jgi:two-component system chemotaxis sensor kinase CheA
MGIDVSRFIEIFLDETEEQLASLEKLLLAFDVQHPDAEDVNAIFRIAHSIKGGAGTFGFADLIDITHVMETMLGKIRHGDAVLTGPHRDVFLQAKDVLKMQLDGIRQNCGVDTGKVAHVRSLLSSMAEQGSAVSQPSVAAGAPVPPLPPLPSPTPEPDPDQTAMPTGDSPAPVLVQAASVEVVAGAVEASTIRVNIEKVDQLINLVGELVITQAMLLQRTQALGQGQHEGLLSDLSQLSRNTRDLQQSVLSIRMMPMDFVFSRFPRLVHGLSSQLGKQINFVTEGSSTELDKGLIEKIIDPLTHLVRNSIDHGIETPSVRLGCRKSEVGLLKISALHQSGHIVIEVHDDGAGLNREKILAKARALGHPIDDSASDDEVWQLIFLPGISTAEVVTDVSGRGVGMDVVKRNINGLGGTVSVSSRPGKSTTTRISLPLTLAILEGMSVRVGGETYMLPLASVIESFQPRAQDIKGLNNEGLMVLVRGDYLPIISLGAVFDIAPLSAEPTSGILVIVAKEARKAALWIDELAGQQQVVVKNIETHYRKVRNVSGATILGDGSVALIVDIGALLNGA